MKLTTIGTGTVAPHARRVCAGHLVEEGEVKLLLDCGSGVVHRMATLGIDWSEITDIALTHFHPDHVSDLAILLFAFRYGQAQPRTKPLSISGPPGLTSFLRQISELHGAWLLDPGYPFEISELAPKTTMRLGDVLNVSNHRVPHTDESIAYSIGNGVHTILYTGDTGPDSELAEWARGCDVLLSECSLPDDMSIPTHLTPSQAGIMAAEAEAGLLVLTHFYPPVEEVDIVAEVAKHYSGRTVLSEDGWSIYL